MRSDFRIRASARDNWAAKDLGTLLGNFKVRVPGHGVVLLRVSE